MPCHAWARTDAQQHHPTNPHSSSFHAIVGSAATGSALLSSSPLSFTPSSSSTASPWTLKISHSFHDHALALRSSPLYGSYKAVAASKSTIAWDLSGRVPEGIAKRAVCDWVTDSPRERRAWLRGEGAGVGGVPWRVRRRERERLAVERGEEAVRQRKGWEGKERERGDNQAGWDGEDLEEDMERRKRVRRDVEAYEHWAADDTSIAEQEEMERDRQG